jgi:hypothetical protein
MVQGTISAIVWRDNGKTGRLSCIFVGIVEGT